MRGVELKAFGLLEASAILAFKSFQSICGEIKNYLDLNSNFFNILNLFTFALTHNRESI